MRILYLSILALAAFSLPAPCADELPESLLPGWTADPIQKYRTPQELFAYMDGGAELYLEYRFKRLLVREYHHPQMGDVTAEIWHFDEPQDAYGIFHLDPTGLPMKLGQEGRRPDSTGLGSFRFWKGSHFVRIFAWQSHDGLPSTLDSLTRAIDSRLLAAAELPDWLARLDSAGLNPIFLRGEIALCQAAGNQMPDISAISMRAGAAWVKPQDGSAAPGLIIHTADEKAAGDLFHKICSTGGTRSVVSPLGHDETHEGLTPRPSTASVITATRGLFRRPDGSVEGVERSGPNVIWLPRAADESSCGEMLDRMKDILRHNGMH